MASCRVKAWRGGVKSMGRKAGLRLVPVVLSFACLFGCGSPEPERNNGTAGGDTASSQPQAGSTSQVQEVEDTREPADFEPYQAPEFADSVFQADMAEGNDSVLLDLSSVQD